MLDHFEGGHQVDGIVRHRERVGGADRKPCSGGVSYGVRNSFGRDVEADGLRSLFGAQGGSASGSAAGVKYGLPGSEECGEVISREMLVPEISFHFARNDAFASEQSAL